MGNYSQPFPTVIDAIIKALETRYAERVTGAHFGTLSGVRFRGKWRTGARSIVTTAAMAAGELARRTTAPGRFRTMAHGDTRIIPIELQESISPYRIEEFSLREDSAAPANFVAAWASANVTRS